MYDANRVAFMLVGLLTSIVAALIVALCKKKTPPPYLSPKYSNSEIPVSKIFEFLKLCNRLTNEDLANERYIQRKL